MQFYHYARSSFYFAREQIMCGNNWRSVSLSQHTRYPYIFKQLPVCTYGAEQAFCRDIKITKVYLDMLTQSNFTTQIVAMLYIMDSQEQQRYFLIKMINVGNKSKMHVRVCLWLMNFWHYFVAGFN